jgi:hypothetical protein
MGWLVTPEEPVPDSSPHQPDLPPPLPPALPRSTSDLITYPHASRYARPLRRTGGVGRGQSSLHPPPSSFPTPLTCAAAMSFAGASHDYGGPAESGGDSQARPKPPCPRREPPRGSGRKPPLAREKGR